LLGIFIDEKKYTPEGLPVVSLEVVTELHNLIGNFGQNDESKLKEELLKVRTLYEIDQISEEEYTKREDEILKRLEAIRQRKSTQVSQ